MALPVISRGIVEPGHEAHYAMHMCPPDQPSFTPDRVTPNVVFNRDLAVDVGVKMPDGKSVAMWVIQEPGQPPTFPGAAIRVREGQIAHTITNGKKHRHTLHHHGIEPTPFNDGVGHCSFVIGSDYAYQWQANQAGTFFYHCHVNTVLHFEYGLYALLIVDPPEGPGRLHRGGPAYTKEYFWVPDEIDPTWHTLGHSAFYQAGCTADGPFSTNGILHYFNPKYFGITGVFSDGAKAITDPRIAVTAKQGEQVLIRTLNAGYTVQRFTLGVGAWVWGMDGKAMGGGKKADGTYNYPQSKYSKPIWIPAGTPFMLSTAQRWDLILDTTKKGVFNAQVVFMHWVSGATLKTLKTSITVA